MARRVAPAPRLTTALVSRAEARVVIRSVGIDQAVFLGGQASIDRWVVTHFSDPGWRPPTAAGAPGTYWLAGHRTAGGGPFHPLPAVAIGDLVEVQVTGGSKFVYQVTSKEVTDPQVEQSVVYGNDPNARLILLQTCVGHNERLLVHGVLVAPS
ncbi:MAG: sortase [Acidimicrobiales bacterium]